MSVVSNCQCRECELFKRVHWCACHAPSDATNAASLGTLAVNLANRVTDSETRKLAIAAVDAVLSTADADILRYIPSSIETLVRAGQTALVNREKKRKRDERNAAKQRVEDER